MARGVELKAAGITLDGRRLADIKETSPGEYAALAQKISDDAFKAIGMTGSGCTQEPCQAPSRIRK